MSDLVSIVMPTFNSEKFIEASIDSIINQTYQNWELLITDDCSTDGTVQIINKYRSNDERIHLFRLDKNLGAGYARNKSINESQGRYIAFCDSDDQWYPEKLEIQISFMGLNNLSFTYSSYEIIGEDGNFKKTIKAPKKITFKKMLRNNYVGCLTAIYDTEMLGKMLMPTIRKRQDWVLWLNIIKRINSTLGIDKPLAIYRDRKKSISTNKLKVIKYNWCVYRKELNYGFLKSIILLVNFLIYYAIKKL